jgi:polysaccharide biosynthesis protein PelF
MKVALTAEGTYPHQFGGVSVWCDQLIRGMPDHDFLLVPLVASGAEPVRWDLPPNVRSVAPIPLWGVSPPVTLRARLSRNRAVPPLAELIDVLFMPPAHAPDRFADVMRELSAYAQAGGDLRAALASEDAIRTLSGAWQANWPHILPGPPGDGGGARSGTAPTLHDAVVALQLIEHALRPLSHLPAQADVVHAVTNGLGALPALAAKWRYGTPLIVSEHGVYVREQYLHLRRPSFGWPVKELFLRFLRRVCALGYQQADVITPGNAYNKRWEEQLGADVSRVRTVYNGVNPADFPPLTGEPDVPTIAWVGRVDPVKDLETLLRAFSLVLREMPQARLRMFGAPPQGREAYLAHCQALAGQLGLTDRAVFEGRVPVIRDAYSAGQIVVLCSITEGFPYTLIEAMASGRPCVATDVGGVSEALGRAGLIVPPRNPAALADACLQLLLDPGLRKNLGHAARLRALEHFTVDRAISTFDEMYSFLGTGRPIPDGVPQRALPAPMRPAEEATLTLPRVDAAALAADAETTLVLPRIDAPDGPPCEPE